MKARVSHKILTERRIAKLRKKVEVGTQLETPPSTNTKSGLPPIQDYHTFLKVEKDLRNLREKAYFIGL